MADIETFSEMPMQNATQACAENIEIMLFAWAIISAPVQVWAPYPVECAGAGYRCNAQDFDVLC